MTQKLKRCRYQVNKKKVQRLIQKLQLQVNAFTKKNRKYDSYKGCAYQMNTYIQTLKENRIFQSMSRKGTCLDNSIMENFFSILKQELYYGKVYQCQRRS